MMMSKSRVNKWACKRSSWLFPILMIFNRYITDTYTSYDDVRQVMTHPNPITAYDNVRQVMTHPYPTTVYDNVRQVVTHPKSIYYGSLVPYTTRYSVVSSDDKMIATVK